MARYLVQVPRETLSDARKAAIAATIGEVHHEITERSADEVEVAITEIDAGCFFAGGSLIECSHLFVHGYIPDNWLFEGYRARLIARLADAVTEAADFDPDSTWVTISEQPGR